MPITHEGAEYYSKTEVEDRIKERVRGEQQRYTELETKWNSAQPQLAQVTTLTQERDEWKGKATKIETRYTAATQYGITDTETLEALEAAHEKAMGKVAEGQRVDFGTYLGHVKQDPTLLPSFLRGVFSGQGQSGQQQGGGQNQQQGGQQGGAGGGQNGQQGGGQQQGGPQRPAWASSHANQQRVEPGNTPTMADKAKGAKTMSELAAIQEERRRQNRGR
jgi:hypothetical protein